MRKGVKTTEFWISVLTIIGSTAASFEGMLDPKYAAVVAGISSVAYTISRAISKMAGDLQMSDSKTSK